MGFGEEFRGALDRPGRTGTGLSGYPRIGKHLESEGTIYCLRDVTIEGTSVIHKSGQGFNI
jgi:hypothetical protein